MGRLLEMERKFWIMLMLASVIKLVYSDAKQLKTLNMDPIDVTEWGLPEEEKYPQIVELNEENFNQKVLEVKDSWIVVVHTGKINKNWISLSKLLSGSLWFGSIDLNKQKNLATKWVQDINENKIAQENVALVFPFGKLKKERLKYSKAHWPKLTTRPTDAENLAASTFSNLVDKFTFKPDSMKLFQDWVIQAYYHSDPPKFPVLCITDQAHPTLPLSLLAVANYFENFFDFGVVRKENVGYLRSHFKELPEPTVYPHYVVLLGKEPSKEEMNRGVFGMHFDILPFQPSKYGPAELFVSIVKFLFTANEDYRKRLPGRASNEPTSISNLATVRQSLKKRVRAVNQHFTKDEL